jgi:hypothetical protein
MPRVIIPVTAKKGKIGYYGFYDKSTNELISVLFYRVSESEERKAEAERLSDLFLTKIKIKRL